MTNYEKYKELVIRCVLTDSICKLADEAYGNKSCGERTCKECAEFMAEWLKRECSEIDWSKVPVDTPVIIKDKDVFTYRHFAKYCYGHVYVYANGETSWTTNGEKEGWEPGCVELGRAEDNIKYAKQ